MYSRYMPDAASASIVWLRQCHCVVDCGPVFRGGWIWFQGRDDVVTKNHGTDPVIVENIKYP